MGTAEEQAAKGRQSLAEWNQSRSQASLDAAITAFLSSINGPWENTMSQTECLGDLLTALSAGAQAGSDRYTDQLIEVAGQALQLSDKDPWLRGQRGMGEMLRYERHGSLDDLNAAVIDFKTSLAYTPAGDTATYGRAINMAWASEARFDRLGGAGEDYMVIQQDGVERWRGPRDLVNPIMVLENLLQAGSGPLPPCPPEELPLLKRNLANLYCRYAIHVSVRPQGPRAADMRRAVALLQEAMVEVSPGSFDYTTIAESLVATVEQGQGAGLLPLQ